MTGVNGPRPLQDFIVFGRVQQFFWFDLRLLGVLADSFFATGELWINRQESEIKEILV